MLSAALVLLMCRLTFLMPREDQTQLLPAMYNNCKQSMCALVGDRSVVSWAIH